MADVSWSLGEISALAIKAVRGSGLPWGLAEEAGWALRWLGRAGQPGPAALARALRADDLSALLLGVQAADRGGIDGDLGPVGEPLLAVPFLTRCVPPGAAWSVETDGGAFRVWQTGCDPVPVGQVLRKIGEGPAPDPLPSLGNRIAGDAAAIAVLTRFAARTYAPATEASRQAGAGAGLTDND